MPTFNEMFDESASPPVQLTLGSLQAAIVAMRDTQAQMQPQTLLVPNHMQEQAHQILFGESNRNPLYRRAVQGQFPPAPQGRSEVDEERALEQARLEVTVMGGYGGGQTATGGGGGSRVYWSTTDSNRHWGTASIDGTTA